jgi:hypothetical protein
MIDYNQWITFGQSCFNDYATQNKGRRPFVSHSPETRWAYGRENVTQEMYDATVRREQDYEDWFAQTVLHRDNQSCSNAIYATTCTGIKFWSATGSRYMEIGISRVKPSIPVGWS